jgi:hypothetical protein
VSRRVYCEASNRGGDAQTLIQGDETEAAGFTAKRSACGGELEGVARAERVAEQQLFSPLNYDVRGVYDSSAAPRLFRAGSQPLRIARGQLAFSHQPREGGNKLNPRSPPDKQGCILLSKTSDHRREFFFNEQRDDGGSVPEPHQPASRSSNTALRIHP